MYNLARASPICGLVSRIAKERRLGLTLIHEGLLGRSRVEHARKFTAAARNGLSQAQSGQSLGPPNSTEPSEPRDPPESPEDPVKASKLITWGTVGLCTIVYGYYCYGIVEAGRKQDPHVRPLTFLQRQMVCSLDNWQSGRWWTLLTASFCHGNLFHLLGNMYILWNFGPLVAQHFGVRGFVATWCVSSVLCCGATLWHDQRKYRKAMQLEKQRHDDWTASDVQAGLLNDPEPLAERPQSNLNLEERKGKMVSTNHGSVGASGALLGFSTALMCEMPRLRVQIFFVPISMTLWFFNGAFGLFELYNLWQDQFPAIGHAGHLGGMCGGILTYYYALRPWARRLRL